MANKVHIGARIQPELRQFIEEEADRNGITISEQIAAMLTGDASTGLTSEAVRVIVREELGQHDDDTSARQEDQAMNKALPNNLRHEIAMMMDDAHYLVLYDQEDPLFLPDFLLRLAEEAEDYAESAPQRIRETMDMPDLEKDLIEEVNQTIERVLENIERPFSRNKFLTTFAEYLRNTADLYYTEVREVQLSFSSEEWEQLDQFLDRINRNRSEKEKFPNLETYLKWILGKSLKDQAGERLFGGYERPEMAELGKTLQIGTNAL